MKPGIRNTLIAIAALVGLGCATAALLLPHDEHYTNVDSVAATHDFQDPALLARAWTLPVAAAYRRQPYENQANPSFCGPTSVANLLHSEGQSATQNSVLAGSDIHPVFGFLPRGLTLDQEAALLRHATGRRVTLLRNMSLAAFRAELAKSNDLATRYVINFNRGPLFGRGHGHLSPILGYLAAEDLVFVGDVNGDYRPFLVSSARLYAAMDTVDSDSGQKRGLLRLEAHPQTAPGPQQQ